MIEIDTEKVRGVVIESLANSDGGEIFFEHFQQEVFSYSDGLLAHSDFSERKGFGCRSFIKDRVGFVHSAGFEMSDILNAAKLIKGFKIGSSDFSINLGNAKGLKSDSSRYFNQNPLQQRDFVSKVDLLKMIDEYIRSKSSAVQQVTINLNASLQEVKIINPLLSADDSRPMVRISIVVVVQEGSRMEIGSHGLGGRFGYDNIFSEWKDVADNALRQALVNLGSVPVEAGAMTVVLANGFPGVLLHEAVGHGLEGDANRKKSSAFYDLMGKKVAASGVTVVDDATIVNKRGSLNVDDEGTPARCNVLIEDGILVGYMNDCINGRLLGGGSTGNGRRENYTQLVIPRMTNTYMLVGEASPGDIIASVKKGIYAVGFSGGQVDVTSGKFVFSTSEAYLIENGKVASPVKNTTLIGNGPDVLTKISMIGNDLSLDSGTGTCGKDGQQVPVCVGQPTLCVDSITVGGSQ